MKRKIIYEFDDIPSYYKNFCDKECVIFCDYYNHPECPKTCGYAKKLNKLEKMTNEN